MEQLEWAICGLSSITLIGVFIRMKAGFGTFNLRVVGIVFIASLAGLLALNNDNAMTAAMGIYGAIAGYLFGLKD